MSSVQVTVIRDGDELPRVVRVPLIEGVGSSGWTALHLYDEEEVFFRRYAVDVRAEFKRALARRSFFKYWQPEMEAI